MFCNRCFVGGDAAEKAQLGCKSVVSQEFRLLRKVSFGKFAHYCGAMTYIIKDLSNLLCFQCLRLVILSGYRQNQN